MATEQKEEYRKYYVPLESNPEVFTELIQNLGVDTLQFQDVYSVEEPDLMAMVSRPVYALVLIFPSTSDAYKNQKTAEEATRSAYVGKGDGEDVVWFKQTIDNACGLYAILHAVCNGDAKNLIPPTSKLAKLLDKVIPLDPVERARALEDSKEVEEAHARAAIQGSTAAPDANVEVDYHYVAFVKSHKNNRLYEMDGSKKGPVDKGVQLKGDEDLFSEGGLSLVKEFIKREQDGNPNFSLMALVPQQV
ncbi:cysteine proteinase [Guyanagaster necrorhizus]|uniref:Ubiquitin carboxyl-terminal hydrolase n=1 Tax=Guyanagaster necrorhizus TaxID=856835 RepID=A0A9P8AXQ3_9AGAR|nr:cysteine proteinase [Guyanagaster necrorhizus MCA 3950]KAG7452029.1 cysteine proteinase [Guyanagaster necrorhizus MCA 3950]